MVLDVMDLDVPGIGWVPLVMRPTTLLAFIFVAAQNFPAYLVGNVPIMFETLPISL